MYVCKQERISLFYNVEMNNESIYIQRDENALLDNIDELKTVRKDGTGKRVFGLKSKLRDEYMSKKMDSIVNTSRTVADYLYSEAVPVDEDGNKLINFSEEKSWFFDNVSFVFSTGMIFDEEDTSRLDNILKCFRNMPNKAYLKNRYFLLDYTNPLVQKIEQKQSISNGNYRIMCAVLVSADEESLKSAPSHELSNRGIARVAVSWPELNDMFATYVSVFGFIAEYFDKQDVHYGNSQRMDRKNAFNNQMSLSPVDLLNTPIEHFPSGGKKKDFDEKDFQHLRTAKSFAEDQRGKNLEVSGDFRKKQGSSLYDRIANSELQDLPTNKQGILYRMDDFFESDDNIDPEYIIYNDLHTYDKTLGKNIYMDMNPDLKKVIPNFSTNKATIDKIMNGAKTTKTSTGSKTRTPVANSVLIFPK